MKDEIDEIFEQFGIAMVGRALDNMHSELKSTIKNNDKQFIEKTKIEAKQAILTLKRKWEIEARIDEDNYLLHCKPYASDNWSIAVGCYECGAKDVIEERIKELEGDK